MNKEIRTMVSILADEFEFPEPIWEIGSFLVEGQQQLADLRPLFPGKQYVGLDMREGPGVDRVENIEHINAPDESVSTILCLNTLEHVTDIFAGARELYRVLKPGGVLIITAPFDFPIHAHPGDYWRFTPQALIYLTRNFPLCIAGSHGHKDDPHTSLLFAFKHDQLDQIEPKVTALQQRLQKELAGKKPHADRAIKLSLARKLAGKKMFRTRDHRDDINLWLVKNHTADR